MHASPQNFYIEILTSNMIVLWGGSFGRALMNGIGALVKEIPSGDVYNKSFQGLVSF